MPVFQLNIFDDVHAADLQGFEHPDLDVGKANAIAGARASVADPIRNGTTIYQSRRIEIAEGADSRASSDHPASRQSSVRVQRRVAMANGPKSQTPHHSVPYRYGVDHEK